MGFRDLALHNVRAVMSIICMSTCSHEYIVGGLPNEFLPAGTRAYYQNDYFPIPGTTSAIPVENTWNLHGPRLALWDSGI